MVLCYYVFMFLCFYVFMLTIWYECDSIFLRKQAAPPCRAAAGSDVSLLLIPIQRLTPRIGHSFYIPVRWFPWQPCLICQGHSSSILSPQGKQRERKAYLNLLIESECFCVPVCRKRILPSCSESHRRRHTLIPPI